MARTRLVVEIRSLIPVPPFYGYNLNGCNCSIENTRLSFSIFSPWTRPTRIAYRAETKLKQTFHPIDTKCAPHTETLTDWG